MGSTICEAQEHEECPKSAKEGCASEQIGSNDVEMLRYYNVLLVYYRMQLRVEFLRLLTMFVK